jgi:hypothetical protein
MARLRRGLLLVEFEPASAPILKTLPPHFGHVPWIAGFRRSSS